MKPMTEKLQDGLAIECIPTSPVFTLVWHGEKIMGPAPYETVKTEARRILEAHVIESNGLENLI